ncbi:MAG TPA: hypothetical protein DDY91_21850 [Planctomycetaceae bacterium]|nr:hypothetical protein [Planctomycetaceae bacterium]
MEVLVQFCSDSDVGSGCTVPERGVEMTEAELPTPVEEGRYHTYVGHVIPWYVRVAWILFWIGSAAYVLRYLLPALQRELGNPP